MPVTVMTDSDAAFQARSGRAKTTAATRARAAALPVMLVTAGSVIGLVSAQGGYFPTSWGPSAVLLLWALGLWLVLSGLTDARRLDVLFLGLLGLFVCWIGLSIAWSEVPGQSLLEVERALVPLAGVATVLVLARREHVPKLAGALLASVSLISAYALATRLFPERLGQYDPVAANRLSDPVGYWNGLGIFAVLGILLAVGMLAEAKARSTRAATAASVVVLAATVYFTFSRASWLALGLGAVVLIASTPRRLWIITTAVAVTVPAALGVLLASRSFALTHERVALARASADGHRLALLIVGLAAIAAALALFLAFVENQIEVPRRWRLACGGALALLALVLVTGLVVREGGPVSMTRDAWDAFNAPPPATGGDLNSRLFNISSNGRVAEWRAARDMYLDHPLTGSGAGTFERFWQAHNHTALKVRDAHSLYLETLAELGPGGLALLVAALLLPLGAGLTVRRSAMLPACLAAYSAFLVHAAVDWDWELSGVTFTALLVGSLAIVAARKRERRTLPGPVRAGACAAVIVASLAAVVAFLGNSALSRAQSAVSAQRYVDATNQANRARKLMPWSPWPLIARGDAQLGVGDSRAAAASYRRAVSLDSDEWRAWFGVALATDGRARASALAHAHRLYPSNAEVADTIAKLKRETKG